MIYLLYFVGGPKDGEESYSPRSYDEIREPVNGAMKEAAYHQYVQAQPQCSLDGHDLIKIVLTYRGIIRVTFNA